jgi:cation diffusion facilitator family transporter
MTKKEDLKKGERLATIAILLEGALAAAKAVIGIFSGSVVLISDAIHSGSDLLSIITSWFGLKIAQKEPDKKFPYGYYKAENLGAAIISILIFLAAWEMLTQGYSRLFSFSLIKIPLLALAISLFDAIILFFFGNYEVKVGKGINAQSLIAMGKENRTHLFSSMAVFIGILAAYYRISYLEGLITIIISFLILKIGLTTAKDSVLALMDVSPGKEIEDQTGEAIALIPGVEEFFDLRLRKAGPFIFGETKIGVRKSIDVKRAHEVANRIEEEVKKKVPQIDSFAIHIEPLRSDFHHLVIPVKEKKGLESSISEEFGRAPYFLFVNLKSKKIKGYYILENPYLEEKVKAGLAVAKLLVEQKSEVLIAKEIGEISFYALRENLFDIYRAEGGKAREVINSYIEGELELLLKPTKKEV